MPTIEPRKNADGITSYRVRVRLKGLPQQTATFPRKTDARLWAQSQEAALREGRYFKHVEAKKHTVADLIDRYIQDVLPGKSKNARSQTPQLQWWKDQLGSVVLSDLAPSKIAAARDALGHGNTPHGHVRAPATVNRYLAALSTALTTAVREWQWLETNPMRRITKLKEPRGRVRYLTSVQRASLLQACTTSRNPFLHTIVVLAISTGMRLGEILSLRQEQVNLERGRIILHDTKNGDSRAVALAGKAKALLAARVQSMTDPRALVFPGRRPDKPVEIKKAWTNALLKAEVNDFRFHDLRHCAASYLLEGGASLGQLAEVLGHRTLQMVKRYAHLSEGRSAEIVAAMNERIFQEQ